MNVTDQRFLKTQERLQNALLHLLQLRDLKAITVSEICDEAGISRNAFYQHYGYKEDLYDQIVAQAAERIREALLPVIHDASLLNRETVMAYARKIIAGVSGVRELIVVTAKGDNGKLLRELTDLIFTQILTNAISFFNLQDSEELRLFYEYVSGGLAAFILRWSLSSDLSEERAAQLLAGILLQVPSGMPAFIPAEG